MMERVAAAAVDDRRLTTGDRCRRQPDFSVTSRRLGPGRLTVTAALEG